MKWVWRLLARNRMYGELSEEIRAHIEEKMEELVADGMVRKEAEAKARREFGNVTLTERDGRDVWRWALVEDLLTDLRYGLRMLRKSPGFSTVAILTIALGVGANAAIFGLVDSAFLRNMPFGNTERLVHIWTIEAADGDTHTPTPAVYQAIRDDSSSYEQVAASGWEDYFYGADGTVQQTLQGLLITANWLPTLGVQPFLGRNFREEEQNEAQNAVVMLSYECWRTRFHADREITGRQIFLNRRAVTVVGVLPRVLGPYFEDIEVFAPLVLESYANEGTLRAGKMRVQITARLKPGATLAGARTEAEIIASRLRSPGVPAEKSDRLVVEDFAEMFRNTGPTARNRWRGLWMTGVAAGVVLLIACANVASLLLARGVKRHREVALRTALGCSRGRMVRQLLTESALLFLCGGGVALIATRWGEEIISKAAAGLVSGGYLHVDARVLVVSLGISLLSALAFGMAPAWQATRVNPNEDLKDGIPSAGGGTRSRRQRNALVAGQIALGMVLLVGFGLLLRSFLHVEASPLGYDPRNVLTATVKLSATRYKTPADRSQLMQQILERVRIMPGVESAGIADSLPMEGAESDRLKIEVPGTGTRLVEEEIWFVSVSPEYFATLRVGMRAGRPFEESEGSDGAPVAIVNQTFAEHYFPDTNPVGFHLAFANEPGRWREIVGVVSDFRQRNPEEDLRPLAYVPVAQTAPARWSVAIRVRAASEAGSVAAHIPERLRQVDPQLYCGIGSAQALVDDSESLTMRRPIITLVASFGSLALFLVVVGVFGVTSYSVAERTREIGIRAALGAGRGEIARLIFAEMLSVAVVGLAAGALGALAVASFFPTEGIGWSGSGIFLYGVTRTDVFSYVLPAALLLMVVIAAAWAPARRAMRVDPMVALRYE